MRTLIFTLLALVCSSQSQSHVDPHRLVGTYYLNFVYDESPNAKWDKTYCNTVNITLIGEGQLQFHYNGYSGPASSWFTYDKVLYYGDYSEKLLLFYNPDLTGEYFEVIPLWRNVSFFLKSSDINSPKLYGLATSSSSFEHEQYCINNNLVNFNAFYEPFNMDCKNYFNEVHFTPSDIIGNWNVLALYYTTNMYPYFGGTYCNQATVSWDKEDSNYLFFDFNLSPVEPPERLRWKYVPDATNPALLFGDNYNFRGMTMGVLYNDKENIILGSLNQYIAVFFSKNTQSTKALMKLFNDVLKKNYGSYNAASVHVTGC